MKNLSFSIQSIQWYTNLLSLKMITSEETNKQLLPENYLQLFFFFFNGKSSLIVVLYSDAFTLHIKLARNDLEIIASM